MNFNRGLFLNYPIKDFIQKEILKKFNEKYKLNIKDTKINELDLEDNDLGNEGLKELCKINFKELKALGLYKNNISDIKVLEKAEFEKLELLDLSENKLNKIQNKLIISKMKSILKI